MDAKLESLLTYCQQSDRICPTEHAWTELWEVLPEGTHNDAHWQPPRPLVLGAWWNSSDRDKRLRLQEQIHWAADHGALDAVDAFLRRLPEADWHHGVA